MKTPTILSSIAAVGLLFSVPSGAVSLGAGSPQPQWSSALDLYSPGSAALLPRMAAEIQPSMSPTVEQPTTSAPQVGKPIDDMSFVRAAMESGRKEVNSSRDALPLLQNPGLKQIAQMLVDDHSNANARLQKLAEVKGWATPAVPATPPPVAATAPSDFDAHWVAEMIAGHERSVALYRAQAQGGEDAELRKFARETLPTIEHHLAELKTLQK